MAHSVVPATGISNRRGDGKIGSAVPSPKGDANRRGGGFASVAVPVPPPPSRCAAFTRRILQSLDPRRRLAARLGWLTALLVAVYLVCVVVSVDQIARHIVNQQTGRACADLAYQTSNVLDRIMFERWREAQTLATLPQVYNNSVGDDTLLNTLQASFTDYAWIGIASADGFVVASTQHLLHGANITQRPWFQAGRYAPFVGDLHDALLLARLLPTLPNGDPQRFVDIACPLYWPAIPPTCTNVTDPVSSVVQLECVGGSPRRFNGVIAFHLSWLWASDIRNQALNTANVDDSVELLILDRNGLVLLGAEERGDGNDQKRVVAGTTVDNGAMHAAQAGENSYSYEQFVDGEWLTGYAASRGFRDYPGLGWLVLVRQPASQALAPAVYLQRVILLIVLLVGAALVLFIVAIISRSARPLQDMAAAANDIAEQIGERKPQYGGKSKGALLLAGDSSAFGSHTSRTASSLSPIHVTLPATGRPDEVGLLGASFGELLRVLNAHRAELQGVNAALEAKVQSRTVELEMINRELEMFSQTVSHDLRAPLGSIRASAELLQADLKAAAVSAAPAGSSDALVPSSPSLLLPPTVDEYLGQIQTDVSTMSGLITDLLELSRINHSALRIKKVNLAAMAQGILADLQRQDEARAPHVTVMLPPVAAESDAMDKAAFRNTPASRLRGLSPVHVQLSESGDAAAAVSSAASIIASACRGAGPASPTGSSSAATAAASDSAFIVQGDEGLIRVILTNLLSNSWKYTSKKAHAVIEFGCVGPADAQDGAGGVGGSARSRRAFFVRDNGAGFSMSHARRLFQPFQRMHAQSEFKGVGVGLCTVSRCCQRHGGRVWAKAAPGRGATFFFTLEPWTDGSGTSGAAEAGAAPSVQLAELPPLPSVAELREQSSGTERGSPAAGGACATPDATEAGAPNAAVGLSCPSLNLSPLSPSSRGAAAAEAPASSFIASSGGAGSGAAKTASAASELEGIELVRFHDEREDEEQVSLPPNHNSAATAAATAAAAAAAPVPAVAAPSALSPRASPSGNKPSLNIQLPKQSVTALPDEVNSPGSARVPERQPRVLFVDDSFVLTKLGSRILSSNGVLVDTASDGLEAVRKIYPAYAAEGDLSPGVGGGTHSPQADGQATELSSQDGSGGGGSSAHSAAGDDETSRGQQRPHGLLAVPLASMGSNGVARRAGHVRADSFGLSQSYGEVDGDSLAPSHVADGVLVSPMTSPLLPLRHSGRRMIEQRQRYDLVFCDLQMSGMDGITCVSTLRHLGYNGRVVALTGFDDQSKRDECRRAGFDDFLAKPFAAASLMAMLQQHKGKPSEYRYS